MKHKLLKSLHSIFGWALRHDPTLSRNARILVEVAQRTQTENIPPTLPAMLDPRLKHERLFGQALSCLIWEGHPTIGETVTPAQYAAARHSALSPALEQAAALRDRVHPLMAARNVVVRTHRFSALPVLIVGTDLVVTATSWLAQYLAHLHPLKVVSSPIPGVTANYVQWEPVATASPTTPGSLSPGSVPNYAKRRHG